MITAYHFTGPTLRDGRPVPAVGEKLVYEGEIVWCQSGLYASRKPHQALKFARGALLHIVECDRIEREDDFKLICRERTIIKSMDATDLLRRFAADQALSVAYLWDMPDIVRKYLTTIDDGLREDAWRSAQDAAMAAWDAVWDAAGGAYGAADDAARISAWDAARSARNAARPDVLDAARDAGLDAAWASARRPGRDIAFDTAKAAMGTVRAAAPGAPGAAEDAVWEEFDSRVYAAFDAADK